MTIQEAISKVGNLTYKPFIEIDSEETQAINMLIQSAETLEQLEEKLKQEEENCIKIIDRCKEQSLKLHRLGKTYYTTIIARYTAKLEQIQELLGFIDKGE